MRLQIVTNWVTLVLPSDSATKPTPWGGTLPRLTPRSLKHESFVSADCTKDVGIKIWTVFIPMKAAHWHMKSKWLSHFMLCPPHKLRQPALTKHILHVTPMQLLLLILSADRPCYSELLHRHKQNNHLGPYKHFKISNPKGKEALLFCTFLQTFNDLFSLFIMTFNQTRFLPWVALL